MTSFHARKLLRELGRLKKKVGPLTILTHDHPDPDALASAWALAHLVKSLCRVRTRIVYGGVIGRKENRTMAENLEIPASPLRQGELADADHVALIDTQPPFRNNRFPRRRRPDIIIDHHPRNPLTQAGLVLIDESVGATSTIMAEALISSGVRIPRGLATAIVYGIGSETQNLGRGAGARDVAAYQAMWPKANMKALWQITFPRRHASFFQTLSHAIRNAFICRGIIGVHLGPIPTPDLVAQMADFLMTHEKMRWSIVTGRYQDRLHVSLRTSDPLADAGRLLKRLLGKNRGGGHPMIAGGSVDMKENGEIHWRETEEKAAADFLHSVGIKDPAQRSYPFRNSD